MIRVKLHGDSRDATPAAPKRITDSPSPPAGVDAAGLVRWLWERGWLPGLLLVAATLLSYWPCLHGEFVWDDDSWTTMLLPYLRGFPGLVSLWHHPTILQQYYPLTATTFWIDYHLWGFWTVPYHIENVALHSLAAILFWRLLRRLDVSGAWLAAAVFALHPVMVESAAWITERKNVLSLVLYLAAVLAYGRFVDFWQPNVPGLDTPAASLPGKRRRIYLLALLLTLGALLAKTTAFSLPPALLLIAWWKHGRLRWRSDIVPTLPFFAVAVVMGLVTAWLEKHHVGASGPQWDISFAERCLIAGRALWFYTAKLLWPAGICFVYPRWQLEAASLRQWLFPSAAILTLVALWFVRGRIGRGPVTAVLFFLGTLFPVLGFMNAYFMRYSFVCDHWVYLSSLGLLALFAATLARAANWLRAPTLLCGVAAVLLPVLAALTWRQSAMYADVETLYRTTLARNPNANLARNNLATVLIERRRFDEAAVLFRQAMSLDPNEPIYHNNLAATLTEQGLLDDAIAEANAALQLKPDYSTAHFTLADALLRKGLTADATTHFQKAAELEPNYGAAYDRLGTIALNDGRVEDAIAYYEKAVKVQPRYPKPHNNLGEVLLRQGRVADAMVQFRQAMELTPNEPVPYYNLATASLQTGQVDDAITFLQRAVALKPDYVTARFSLASALNRAGRIDDAIAQYRQVLELEPDLAEAHTSLGVLAFRRAQPSDAIAHFQKALELQPENAEAYNNLAWVLATCPDASYRNGPKAIQLANDAMRISQGTNASVLATLAAAYAETGKFPDAIASARRALDLAANPPNPALLQTLRQQLALYEAGSPLRPRTNSPALPKLP